MPSTDGCVTAACASPATCQVFVGSALSAEDDGVAAIKAWAVDKLPEGPTLYPKVRENLPRNKGFGTAKHVRLSLCFPASTSVTCSAMYAVWVTHTEQYRT